VNRVALKLLAFVLSSVTLFGAAAAPSFEYSVWAGASPDADVNRPPDATYFFNRQWREDGQSHDEWILARKSRGFVRIQPRSGQWLVLVHGTWRPVGCNVGPFGWAIAPSGRVAACVAGNFPHQTIHIVRVDDGKELSVIQVPNAYIEGRNKIAFADDDDVLYASLDDSCPRERLSHLSYSIAEIPLSRPLQQHVVFRCASGIIAGTSRVGYLREHGTQFSLGGGWTNGSLYGFDENDGPITDETPALQQFRSTHPDLVVWLVSAGGSPDSMR